MQTQRQTQCLREQGGEDDLDALLAQFKLEEADRKKVSVQRASAPPSARLFASLTAISNQVGRARASLDNLGLLMLSDHQKHLEQGATRALNLCTCCPCALVSTAGTDKTSLDVRIHAW